MLITALINDGVRYSVALIMVTLTNVLNLMVGGGGGGGGGFLYRAHWKVTNKSSGTGVLDGTVEVANLRCFRAIPSAILTLTVVF